MNLKKGDKVIIISGVNKGKTGTITHVLEKQNRVVVEGEKIRKNKKHLKPSQSNPDGGIMEIDAPIHASNVMILDPKTNVPTRIGHKTITVKAKSGKKTEEVTKKVRFAKKSGEVLD